jgi:cell surface protein SprA
VDISLRFSNDDSRNESTQITGNGSMSAFRMGEKNDPLPFPEWTVRWSSLEKIAFFKKYIERLSFDHSFTGKSTESWQGNVNNITTRTYNANFRPLIGFNLTWKNKISTTIRYNTGSSVTDNASTGKGSRTGNSDFSIQGKYSRSSGFRIPIPVWPFKNKEFKNNIDITFEFSMRNDISEQNTGGRKWTVMDKTSKWSLKPQLTYRFSNNVSGGVNFEYGKNDSEKSGKTVYKDFGLNVRIDITGR